MGKTSWICSETEREGEGEAREARTLKVSEIIQPKARECKELSHSFRYIYAALAPYLTWRKLDPRATGGVRVGLVHSHLKLRFALLVCEIECAGFLCQENSIDTCFKILADWKAAVSRKTRNPNFEQTLETLRAHSFDVTMSGEVPGGVLVSKHGAGAVLVAAADKESPAAFAVRPGALVGSQVARLLDRGYQKFIKTPQFELPAAASQLQAIHLFTEELKQLTGAINLYNESLGTTSDLYRYDRLKGREAAQPAPLRPWETAGGE
jgi:hypothetical protein